MFRAAFLAVEQMTDPVFLGVVAHSVVWSVLAFVLVAMGVFYGGQALLAGHDWLGWLAGLAGAIGTVVLSLWLFLPLAAVIAYCFVGRIAAAVERAYYPDVPPGHPASILAQTNDAIVLGLRVLLLQLVALIVTLVPPHVTGLAIGWLIASWAVGRGLFVPVAMLRMNRASALLLYRGRRGSVIFQGALVTGLGFVPVLNLIAPVLGVAAMVHLLHDAMREHGFRPDAGGGRVVRSAPAVLGHPGPRSAS